MDGRTRNSVNDIPYTCVLKPRICKLDKPIDVAHMFSYAWCWQSTDMVAFSLPKEEKISLKKI